MERRTLLLMLIAMLTLLFVADGMDVPTNFHCHWETCGDGLKCSLHGYNPDIRYTLTLDDVESVQCQQSDYFTTMIECIYENLLEETFFANKNHKFELRLETANEVQIQKFSKSLAKMVRMQYKMGSLQYVRKHDELCRNSSRRPEPLANGFYYDLEKKELHIYWQPEEKRSSTPENYEYKVFAGKEPEVWKVTKYSAILPDWNADQPKNVSICGANFVGNSINCSYLDVPILTNAHRRQPQNVSDDINTNRITWKQPMEEDKLVGYTVYWCLVSSSTPSQCDGNLRIESQTLNKSQSMFPFNKTVSRYHTAVVALYSDGISGGLRWSTPAPAALDSPDKIWYLVFIVGATILIMFALIVLSLVIFRKVRYMAAIKVTLPDFQVKLVKTSSFTTPIGAAPIEGHFSPKAMGITVEEPLPQNLDRQTMRRRSEDQSKPDRRLSTSSYGYGPPPYVPPAVSENFSKEVGYTVITGSECLEKSTVKTSLSENPYVATPS